MNVEVMLPIPTDDELNLGYKSEYYHRVIDMNLDRKYKINEFELYYWIHFNYTSVFLHNEELSLNKFRKLINK